MRVMEKKSSFNCFTALLSVPFLLMAAFYIVLGLLGLGVLETNPTPSSIQDSFRVYAGAVNLLYGGFILTIAGLVCFSRNRKPYKITISSTSGPYPFEYRHNPHLIAAFLVCLGLPVLSFGISSVAAEVDSWKAALTMPIISSVLALLLMLIVIGQRLLLLRIEDNGQLEVLVQKPFLLFPFKTRFPLEDVRQIDFLMQLFKPDGLKKEDKENVDLRALEGQLHKDLKGENHPMAFVKKKTHKLESKDGAYLEAWITHFVFRGPDGEELAKFPINMEDKEVKKFFKQLPKDCTGRFNITVLS